jgi:F420-dependent oxidoreductase-like protein
MDVGVHMINFTLPGGPGALRDHVAGTAEAAEEAGCTLFTFMDHYFQMEAFTRSEDPMLEGYTALGFVAGRTETMQLGLLVTGVTYRYPGLLAKIVTTLDVLSGGRAMLGLGAAWYEREHLGLGVPYPPIAERFERLEETLQICLQMWSDDDGAYDGVHYRLERTLNSPQPLTKPHPPILIGGSGERKTLRLVAQYAQACNLFGGPDLDHKLDVLRAHCAAVGRDYDDIEKTVMFGMELDATGSNAHQILDDLASLSERGISHAHCRVGGVSTLRPLELIGEKIIPAAAGL